MTLLEQVKLALRLTVDDYNNEIMDLIMAAQADLGVAGVVINQGCSDPLIRRAIITYCKVHFLGLTDGEFYRLKASYDEQKAQLSMNTGHTNWLGVDG